MSATRGITDREILIGLEGRTGGFSADQENLGARMAMREANDSGGIHGRRLVERSHPRAAGNAAETGFATARRLAEVDGVFLLFNLGGIASLKTAPWAMQQRIPYLFPHTGLLTMNADRYVFTSYPRYAGEARVMLRHLARERGMTRIGMVYDEDAYGQFFLARLHEHAAEFGYTVAGTCAVSGRHPPSLVDKLAALRGERPQALLLPLYPEQAARVLEAKAALDWRDLTLVTMGPLTDEQYLRAPDGHAEGTLGFCYYPDPGIADLPGVIGYREALRRHHPDERPNRYSLYGWTFGRLMIEGLRRAGPGIDRETFIDAMESIRGWDSGGVLPPVSFSSANHHAQNAGFIGELRDGRFHDRSGWIEAA